MNKDYTRLNLIEVPPDAVFTGADGKTYVALDVDICPRCELNAGFPCPMCNWPFAEPKG